MTVCLVPSWRREEWDATLANIDSSRRGEYDVSLSPHGDLRWEPWPLRLPGCRGDLHSSGVILGGANRKPGSVTCGTVRG